MLYSISNSHVLTHPHYKNQSNRVLFSPQKVVIHTIDTIAHIITLPLPLYNRDIGIIYHYHPIHHLLIKSSSLFNQINIKNPLHSQFQASNSAFQQYPFTQKKSSIIFCLSLLSCLLGLSFSLSSSVLPVCGPLLSSEDQLERPNL